MELKIKLLHPDAKIPTYASEGAACFDLRAVGVRDMTEAETDVIRKFTDQPTWEALSRACTFRTGLAFEVPPGWVLKIYSRSGHGFRDGVRLSNCVGIIDSDYRGEVLVKLTPDEPGNDIRIANGDRIAQAMLERAERASFVQVEELSDTARGAGGFGSTGQ